MIIKMTGRPINQMYYKVNAQWHGKSSHKKSAVYLRKQMRGGGISLSRHNQ